MMHGWVCWHPSPRGRRRGCDREDSEYNIESADTGGEGRAGGPRSAPVKKPFPKRCRPRTPSRPARSARRSRLSSSGRRCAARQRLRTCSSSSRSTLAGETALVRPRCSASFVDRRGGRRKRERAQREVNKQHTRARLACRSTPSSVTAARRCGPAWRGCCGAPCLRCGERVCLRGGTSARRATRVHSPQRGVFLPIGVDRARPFTRPSNAC
eukprot:scaffold172196_cov40-Tisochrysis_lutea.AAC.3